MVVFGNEALKARNAGRDRVTQHHCALSALVRVGWLVPGPLAQAIALRAVGAQGVVLRWSVPEAVATRPRSVQTLLCWQLRPGRYRSGTDLIAQSCSPH